MTAELQKMNQKKLQKWIEGDTFTERIESIFAHNHAKVSRFKQALMIQCNQNPKLLKCTPESILKCAYEIALSGLLPDGRNAYLIPYKEVCTVQFDYKGYVRLILNSPEHQSIHAVIVYSNEEFEIEFGDVTKHKTIFSPSERGEPIGCYTVLTYVNKNRSFCFMSKEEIEKIRDNSQGYKFDRNGSLWVKHPLEMWKKTVIRRHQKTLRLDVDSEAAFNMADPELFAPKRKDESAPEIFDMEEPTAEPGAQQ